MIFAQKLCTGLSVSILIHKTAVKKKKKKQGTFFILPALMLLPQKSLQKTKKKLIIRTKKAKELMKFYLINIKHFPGSFMPYSC